MPDESSPIERLRALRKDNVQKAENELREYEMQIMERTGCDSHVMAMRLLRVVKESFDQGFGPEGDYVRFPTIKDADGLTRDFVGDILSKHYMLSEKVDRAKYLLRQLGQMEAFFVALENGTINE